MLRSCFLSSFVIFRWAVFDDWAAILCFGSARKRKLGRGRSGPASCQVSLNSVQQFLRRSKNCLRQSEVQVAIVFLELMLQLLRPNSSNLPCLYSTFHLEYPLVLSRFCFFQSAQKKERGRGRWDLAFCQVTLNSFYSFHWRSRKCLSQSETRAVILFFRLAQNTTNLVEDVEISLPLKCHWILSSAVTDEKLKMSQPIRGQGGHCVFLIGLQITYLVEDVEILLPVKFRWIPFSRFRGVQNEKS